MYQIHVTLQHSRSLSACWDSRYLSNSSEHLRLGEVSFRGRKRDAKDLKTQR